MSNIKLLQLSSGINTELQGRASDLEMLLKKLNAQPPERSPRSRKSKEKAHA